MARRSWFLAALSAGCLIAAPALAQGTTVLRVRPVQTPESAALAERRGLVPRGAVMTAAERRAFELRLARWRQVMPIKEAMHGHGANIDRSRFGNRRPGWRPPLRSTPASVLASEGTSPMGAAGDPPDTIRMAILRLDFLADRGGTASTGDGRFDLSVPTDTNVVPLDRPPHNRSFYQQHAEALRRYYDVMSYGRTVLEIDVWPSQEDSAYHVSDLADLGPWTFGQGIYDAAVHMTRTMFFAADSQSIAWGERIPWDRYDRYTLIHAGGDLQSDLRQDSPEDIPSFTIFLSDTLRIVFPDSTTRPIDRCSFVPETINQDGYYGTINGVLAHENGHNLFGFADIYDVMTGQTTVGYWTLMDSGNLVGSKVLLRNGDVIYATGLLPPSTDPFQRQFTTDALELRAPTWGSEDVIASNQRSPVMYRVPLTADEYLLLENRYIAPDTLLEFEQDSVTRVILGPKSPDRAEYDALLPGGGILVWHIDESVIPFTTSLRVNPDFGWNSNPLRPGVDVIEADGLADLGDGGSPFALGSPLDPFQRAVTPVLSDSTMPNLIPHQGTRPHVRIDFTSDAESLMTFVARRFWDRPGWPVVADFPPGGPQLLAIDADGDGALDVCWAGGADGSPDSAALFAIRPDGTALDGGAIFSFAQLDHRPMPLMAAVATGTPGPAVFAAVTDRHDPADTTGGKVWLVGQDGQPLAGWPVRLAAPATTPPLVAGTWPDVLVYVGCEDGRVRALASDGNVVWTGPPLPGPLAGRLAFWQTGSGSPNICPLSSASALGSAAWPVGFVACGDTLGNVAAVDGCGFVASGPLLLPTTTSWPRRLGGNGSRPDFLWLRFGGQGANALDDCTGLPTLVAHLDARLWAFCPQGQPLAGWGTAQADTLVAGLGAGDPDGDGFPEVLVQTQRSSVGFVNRSGRTTPGWPRPVSREGFLTTSPPVCADLGGDGRGDVVALNASGVLAALDAAGRTPDGFPLATGSGTSGSLLTADLDGDGRLEVVAPDRFGLVYAWSPPLAPTSAASATWPMVGGDAGRTSALPGVRTPAPPAPTAGPVERGSVKAYPNPARNRPVSFAYTLREEATVEFRILDPSGHEVAAFTRPGQRSENVEVWDPGALPAGLYVARLRFRGATSEQTTTLPVGLLR